MMMVVVGGVVMDPSAGVVVVMRGHAVVAMMARPRMAGRSAPVMMPARMTVTGVAMARMVAAVMGAAVTAAVGRRGHRGVPRDVVGIVERVRGVAVRIVLSGGRSGDGDQHGGEGGQLCEGEFHGRSLWDRRL